MEFIQKALEFMQGPVGLAIMVVLLSISELLGLIPSVKANSIFQAVVNGLKWLKEKLSAPKLQPPVQ